MTEERDELKVKLATAGIQVSDIMMSMLTLQEERDRLRAALEMTPESIAKTVLGVDWAENVYGMDAVRQKAIDDVRAIINALRAHAGLPKREGPR